MIEFKPKRIGPKYGWLWQIIDNLELYETYLVSKEKCQGFCRKMPEIYNNRGANLVRSVSLPEGLLFVRVE